MEESPLPSGWGVHLERPDSCLSKQVTRALSTHIRGKGCPPLNAPARICDTIGVTGVRCTGIVGLVDGTVQADNNGRMFPCIADTEQLAMREGIINEQGEPISPPPINIAGENN